MPEYDNTNRGALFRNKRKETDTQPDYNGTLNVNGQEFWLNAWLETAKSGEKYFKMSVRPKDRQRQDAAPPKGVPEEDLNDDIPFS